MKKLFLSILMLSLMASCGNKKTESKDVAIEDKANITQTLDVGKIETVEVNAEGVGALPSVAINEALKNAIAQVNGVSIDSSSVNMNLYVSSSANVDIDSANGKDSAKATELIQSKGFADQIVTKSAGVVQSFKVNNVIPPTSNQSLYKVEITASISKFKASADANKIKIVVAPLKSTQSSFNIGGKQIPANIVLEPVRQQLIDSLTNSGRFTVLDRDFTKDINDELDVISSGQASNTNIAKIGQALSADLVWVGVVNQMSYDKSVRHLNTSDRDLVGFSGNWSFSEKLINLTTRQIVISNAVNGTFPTIDPTTLGATFDEGATLKSVQNEIVSKATQAIILKTFPISIVQIDGNDVILSQGEGSLVKDNAYKVVKLGKEIKDPQTGQSLGNSEFDCCEVLITKVTPKLSYGTLQNLKTNLDGINPNLLQLRESVKTKSFQKDESLTNVTSKTKSKNKTVSDVESNSSSLTSKQDKDW